MSNVEKRKRTTVDAYVCYNLHIVITKISAEDGKVPPSIACPKCGTEARSQGFHVNQNLTPIYEWYKPTQADILRLTSTMQPPEANRLIEMTNKGLLLSRPIIDETIKPS